VRDPPGTHNDAAFPQRPQQGRRASTSLPYTWPRSSLPDFDAELEKLAVDPRRSTHSGLAMSHLAD